MKRPDIIAELTRKLAEARAENRQLQATIRQRRGSVTRQHMALLAHLKAETERADRAEALVRNLADAGTTPGPSAVEVYRGHMERLGVLPRQDRHA